LDLWTGSAPAQNEWGGQNEKIENYGYNFLVCGIGNAHRWAR